MHDCTTIDVVLKGSVRLITLDPWTKRQASRVYRDNDFIEIPARTPHVFEFLEDGYLVEFKAWYYRCGNFLELARMIVHSMRQSASNHDGWPGVKVKPSYLQKINCCSCIMISDLDSCIFPDITDTASPTDRCLMLKPISYILHFGLTLLTARTVVIWPVQLIALQALGGMPTTQRSRLLLPPLGR